MKLCTLPGCDRKLHANGYCERHYKRWRTHGDPNVVLPRFVPSKDEGLDPRRVGSAQRAEWGCIVTFQNEGGKRLVLHRVGPPRSALANACDTALALDASFRVVVVSTPVSILTDLNGERRDWQGRRVRGKGAAILNTPERAALAGIGRSELIFEGAP